MNRLISLVILSLSVTFSSLAQRAYEPHMSVGAKGGATFSKMAFTPGIDQGTINGATVGITARYAEEKIFGLLAELNVEQRGWKERFDESDFFYQRRLTYIQLPVMTHIYFGSQRLKGFVNLGPSVGIMVADNASSNFDYHNPSSVQGLPLENRHINQMTMAVKNKFDYGISAGAGVEVNMNRKHSILIEGRYYYGLGNIFSAKKKDEFSASRGTSLQITLGYMFHVK